MNIVKAILEEIPNSFFYLEPAEDGKSHADSYRVHKNLVIVRGSLIDIKMKIFVKYGIDVFEEAKKE